MVQPPILPRPNDSIDTDDVFDVGDDLPADGHGIFWWEQPSPRPWWDWWPWSARWRAHTQEAEKEWLRYYSDVYKTKGPDAKTFKQLLQRNGFWFIPNPFQEGSPGHYAFAPDGVTLADVDFLLGRWIDRTSIHPLPPPTPPSDPHQAIAYKQGLISEQWLGLYAHRLHNCPLLTVTITENALRRERWLETQDWEDQAKECLRCLFLHHPRHWSWIKDILHADNVGVLCNVVASGASDDLKHALEQQWKKAQWLSDRAVSPPPN